MGKINTKNLIFGLIVVAIIATAGFLLWQKVDDSKLVGVGVENNLESEKKVEESEGGGKIDTSEWQTKETDFFKISFPKDWFALKEIEFRDSFLITNNSELDQMRDSGLNPMQNEINIRFWEIPSVNCAPLRYDEDFNLAGFCVEVYGELAEKDYDASCLYKKNGKGFDSSYCSYYDTGAGAYKGELEGIKTRQYYIANNITTLSINVRIGDFVTQDQINIIDAIADSVILKNN